MVFEIFVDVKLQNVIKLQQKFISRIYYRFFHFFKNNLLCENCLKRIISKLFNYITIIIYLRHTIYYSLMVGLCLCFIYSKIRTSSSNVYKLKIIYLIRN